MRTKLKYLVTVIAVIGGVSSTVGLIFQIVPNSKLNFTATVPTSLFLTIILIMSILLLIAGVKLESWRQKATQSEAQAEEAKNHLTTKSVELTDVQVALSEAKKEIERLKEDLERLTNLDDEILAILADTGGQHIKNVVNKIDRKESEVRASIGRLLKQGTISSTNGLLELVKKRVLRTLLCAHMYAERGKLRLGPSAEVL